MKRMLVLGRFVKEYEPVRLAEEGKRLGYEVEIIKYGQITLRVGGGEKIIDLGNGKRLEDYELVVMRAASKKGSSMVATKAAILEYLDKMGGSDRVVNGKSFLKYPLLGKVEQGVLMAQCGLPTVPMVSFGSKRGWENRERMVFPIMVKGRFGSHGREVKIVRDGNELERVVNEYKEGNVLIQPVLRVNKWFRCIVVGGKYLGQMRHTQKDKYRVINVEIKTAIPEEKMEELRKICLGATKLFVADYAGIDVGWDEDKQNWVIFEVNRTAQFKYFEKRTGVNVAKEMLEVI